MLMVLMALVELGKTKVHRATRWLWLLLSGGLASAPVACGPGNESNPQPMYGPADLTETAAPDVPDAFQGFDQALYGPQLDAIELPDTGVSDVMPMDVPDAAPADVMNDCEFIAVDYGPAQCTSDAQCVSEHGANWYCAKDAVDLGCGKQVQWNSCREQVDMDAVTPDVPADVAPDSGQTKIYYGPAIAPCTSDQDCVNQYGAGWYCDQADPGKTTCKPS